MKEYIKIRFSVLKLQRKKSFGQNVYPAMQLWNYLKNKGLSCHTITAMTKVLATLHFLSFGLLQCTVTIPAGDLKNPFPMCAFTSPSCYVPFTQLRVSSRVRGAIECTQVTLIPLSDT